MKKHPSIVRAIVGGGLILAGAALAGCSGSSDEAPTTAGNRSAALELDIQYADATRGVRGTFAFDAETFTGVASPSNEGELLDGKGRTIAKWQLDLVKGEVNGTIDGQPFTLSRDALDGEAAALTKTRSGKALAALGSAAHDPRTEAKVPADARVELAVLGVVAADAASGATGDGVTSSSDGTATTSEAVTSCTTTRIERDWVAAHAPCWTWHVCEWRKTCKYPTQTTSSSTYYWTCC